MQFDQPPLIELIAELRWLPTLSGQGQVLHVPTMPQPIFATSLQEEFFLAFTKESARSGWTASERTVPLGVPYLSYQPVLRIRSLKEAESQMMYQLGAGIFSAHALPPYKNWESFRPFAEHGLDSLLRTRPAEDRDKEFIAVILRYLDLFTTQLIGDVPIGLFLTNILGFSLELPPILREQIRVGAQAEPQVSVRLPLSSGLEMHVSVVGNSTVGDKQGILMDTVVTSKESVRPTRDAVLSVWEEAHNAIRRTFVGLTTKIHSMMKPIEVSQ
jgi:uncharacterized protein (TIGR04255 family)